MQNIDSALACIETSSIGFGYRILDSVAKSANIRILDSSPCGSGFLLLFTGETNEISRALQLVKDGLSGADSKKWMDQEIVSSHRSEIADAIFALASEGLSESLIIIESATVSGLLEAVSLLLNAEDLKLIEIRVHKSSSGGAHGFLTGPKAECRQSIQAADGKLRHQDVRKTKIEVIDDPARELRRYFELTCSD